MQLKKIKTFGFKTFAEPTTLDFAGGITAIVGPNGSGKSNLIDAFRWVLGEQSSKSLRSGKMEDVIFLGNDQRKPLGLAEVSITFDNTDGRLPIEFAEVEITRRAYRAGEIEYYINRNQCRLRDIMDLLMGTGLGPGSYPIVSQGQIDQILTSKPADRRALFEETAGINKFLARKNESMRRLEQTEQNAIRINDLISELERRVPELDTQVRRAKRYRKLSARVRDLEILSYLRAGASRRAEREMLKAEARAQRRGAQFGRSAGRCTRRPRRGRAHARLSAGARARRTAHPKPKPSRADSRVWKPITPPRSRAAKPLKRRIRRPPRTRIAWRASARRCNPQSNACSRNSSRCKRSWTQRGTKNWARKRRWRKRAANWTQSSRSCVK